MLSSEARAGVRHLRVRLVSARGAPVLILLLPAARPVAISVEGNLLADPPPRAIALAGGHRLIRSVTTPPGGVLVDLVLAGDGPIDVVVGDQSPGLPVAGAALLAARPVTAVPASEGDVTVVAARVRI